MTLILNLPPDLEARLTESAKARGMDVSAYVSDLIASRMDSEASLSDILKPVHATSELKDLSDKELNEFTNELIRQTRRERESDRGAR